MSDPVDRIVHTFQSLSPSAVEELGALYAPHARFKDPFNDVQGLPEIQRIFRHMYASLIAPRFHITDCIAQGSQCFVSWEFRFCFKHFKQGREQCIVGGSHLTLDDAGRITLHRDYWDAAEELYEKLPVLGSFMRWLKWLVAH